MGDGNDSPVAGRTEDRRARAAARRAKKAKREPGPNGAAPRRRRKKPREDGEGAPSFLGDGTAHDYATPSGAQEADGQPAANPYAPPKEKARQRRGRGRRRHHTRATPMHRFVNLLVDGLVMAVISVGASVVLGMLGQAWIADFAPVVSWTIFFVYFLAFETLLGRTPGKMFTGTIVIADDGQPSSLGRIAIRTLLRLVPFDALSFLGASAYGWHDRWSGTQVVLVEKQ